MVAGNAQGRIGSTIMLRTMPDRIENARPPVDEIADEHRLAARRMG